MPRRRGCWTGNTGPTAIIAYGGETAAACVAAARCLGLHVPRDLSLISFDTETVGFMGPRFTTMLVPHRAVGEAAAKVLLDKFDRPGHTAPAGARAVRFRDRSDAGGGSVGPLLTATSFTFVQLALLFSNHAYV